jgi:hypothetical protein
MHQRSTDHERPCEAVFGRLFRFVTRRRKSKKTRPRTAWEEAEAVPGHGPSRGARRRAQQRATTQLGSAPNLTYNPLISAQSLNGRRRVEVTSDAIMIDQKYRVVI